MLNLQASKTAISYTERPRKVESTQFLWCPAHIVLPWRIWSHYTSNDWKMWPIASAPFKVTQFGLNWRGSIGYLWVDIPLTFHSNHVLADLVPFRDKQWFQSKIALQFSPAHCRPAT